MKAPEALHSKDMGSAGGYMALKASTNSIQLLFKKDSKEKT